jgi:hypothetical protein
MGGDHGAESAGGRQRITVRVVDAATGDEQVSGELTVLPGFCSYSCTSCTYTSVQAVAPPPGRSNTAVVRTFRQRDTGSRRSARRVKAVRFGIFEIGAVKSAKSALAGL